MSIETLRQDVERLWAAGSEASKTEGREVFARLRAALSAGTVRAAAPDPASPTGWAVNSWVKQGILLGFRFGDLVNASMDHGKWPFFDKDTLPMRAFDVASGVRLVPGGSSVRDGAYVGEGVVIMPPSFINIGAYVAHDTMIDSHVLVGSCAQIGARVHLSAGVQIGGVLEPVGELPVIVEDDVVVGGNCGVYEGTIVGERAVLGSGVILNGSTRVYDVVHGTILQRSGDRPLMIPPGAVVVPGSRPVAGAFAAEHGLHVATPLIVKYRDGKTDAKATLEGALR
jgi:2,3,4,5-tetrahydropyridine-2-carboxylate N-succinyltransferase